MAFKTFLPNTTLTAADLNDFRNNPRISTSRSAAVSLTNTTWTAVSLDTEAWKVDVTHSTTVNPSRVTALIAGVYLLNVQASIAASATGYRELVVEKNSGGVKGAGTSVTFTRAPGWTGAANQLLTVTQVNLAAGDYLEAFVWQNSGGALNLNGSGTYLEMVRIGN